MKSQFFFFLAGLQNHDWWNLIGVSAVPHVVVNAEQRGAGWHFAFQGPPHSCCISTQRNRRSFISRWGCSSTEALFGAKLSPCGAGPAEQEKKILDIPVQSESCCHPVGWQWLESAKILAQHLQNSCKHPRQDGRPLKWPWKCSLQRGAVTEHRAVLQPQKMLAIKVLLIFKKCISSPHNPSLKD